MAEKDFLEQFSNDNKKPESFKEEVRTPVVKEKKPLNKKLLIIVVVIAAILAILSYFLFFAPKIEMPNFVEQTKSDVTLWVKQQGIQTQGIVFKEEYSFDYDEDVVISQTIEAGKKIKNDAKITFVISNGADPDELISVPDLESMDKEDIQSWIKENKLQKAKISTSFDEYVEEGAVIDYSFSGCEEDSFTRGCTLKISISKGPQPVGVVTVENFVGKTYSDAATWASSKKIKIVKEEQYSETVEIDKIISQSVEGGQKINEGDLLTVVVSKGKGITMPDLTKMSRDEVDAFIAKNSTIVIQKELHVDTPNYVISQSVKEGTSLGTGDEVEVVTNLGSTFYLSELHISNVVGIKKDVIDDAFNKARYTGIDGFAGCWENEEGVYSYTYEKGIIVSAKAADSQGEEYDINGRLPLDVRIDVVLSKGKIYVIKVQNTSTSTEEPDPTPVTDDSIYKDGKYNKTKLIDALAANSIPFEDNTSNNEPCELYIDGKAAEIIDGNVEIIQGQSVELK